MLLSKEEFVTYMNNLKSFYDYLEYLYIASHSSINMLDNDDIGNISHAYIEMLEKFMDVELYPEIGSDIQFFVNELDFGNADNAHEAIILKNGETIDVSSAEKLYDYLVRCNKEKTSN